MRDLLQQQYPLFFLLANVNFGTYLIQGQIKNNLLLIKKTNTYLLNNLNSMYSFLNFIIKLS